MALPLEVLGRLQRNEERIRNISVMAHVDHGKTTLSDNLIASNGLMHPKLVGELRYLDSREDEQIRGITMKSSSISLVYPFPQKESEMEEVTQSGYLIHLIDSPGHVDFCSEVSTAARLTDGCLIVVDAAEGVCIQTHAVLRQAWDEKVQPCLVVNKIDRLIVALGMSPTEAYVRLKQIVSDVNLVMSTFESERYLTEANAVLAHEEAKEATVEVCPKWGTSEDDAFSPIKGNVTFGSAIDGWGFKIDQFAKMYAAKLGANASALNKALWGDYCFQPKTKSVQKIKPSAGTKGQKPMFVQFVLEPLYNAYSALEPESDYQSILGKIIRGRELQKCSTKALLSKDRKQSFRAVMSAWLPLSEAVLSMVAENLPSPPEAAAVRMTHLIHSQEDVASRTVTERQQQIQEAVDSLRASSCREWAPCIIYVSKIIAVDASWLPREAGNQGKSGDVFLAFGRCFSGVARKGLRVHVLSAAYDPADPLSKHRQTATLGNLYLMMGRGLELLQQVPAGNVLAIEGLDDVVHKSATISSTPFAPPLVSMTFQCAAIVRVAVEPTLPPQLPILEEGLRKLSKADPFVEVEILPTGEHVVGAAGEVHLLTCLKDLRERYAAIDLEVSPPLVAFRESVIESEEEPARVVETSTPTGLCDVRVKAHPLPESLANLLSEHRQELRHLLANRTASGTEELKTRLKELVSDLPLPIQKLMKRTWFLGPEQTGPNVLLIPRPDGSLFDIRTKHVVHLDKKRGSHRPMTAVASSTPDPKQNGTSSGSSSDEEDRRSQSAASVEVPVERLSVGFTVPEAAELLGLVTSREKTGAEVPAFLKRVHQHVESGLIAGFQLATAAGPLCDEPMWGVAFEVDIRLNLPTDGQREPELGEDVYGPFQGQVMTVVKSCCRQAVTEGNPRLVEALYLCEVSTSAGFLSGVYSVILRRRGRILREELREGADVFVVHAYLPLEASFGLADELRDKSSGAASCSLMLSHWERLAVDPFFVPKTEEEREEFGDEANDDSTNLARKLIYAVRKRKGRVVQEKVVESATKQRTLAKKV